MDFGVSDFGVFNYGVFYLRVFEFGFFSFEVMGFKIFDLEVTSFHVFGFEVFRSMVRKPQYFYASRPQTMSRKFPTKLPLPAAKLKEGNAVLYKMLMQLISRPVIVWPCHSINFRGDLFTVGGY